MRCEVIIPSSLLYSVVTYSVHHHGLSYDDAMLHAVMGCGRRFQWYVVETVQGLCLTIDGDRRAIEAALPAQYHTFLKDECILGEPYEDTVADPQWKPQRMGQMHKQGAFARY